MVVPPIRGGFWYLLSNEDEEDGDVSSPSVVIVGASSIENQP
jgi:hypothetical protein